MKKIIASLVLGMLFFPVAIPSGRAVETEAEGTGLSGTPAEYSDLEKTLKKDRIDSIEVRITDLRQENKFLSERIKMLERSFTDLKDKVDRLTRY